MTRDEDLRAKLRPDASIRKPTLLARHDPDPGGQPLVAWEDRLTSRRRHQPGYGRRAAIGPLILLAEDNI